MSFTSCTSYASEETRSNCGFSLVCAVNDKRSSAIILRQVIACEGTMGQEGRPGLLRKTVFVGPFSSLAVFAELWMGTRWARSDFLGRTAAASVQAAPDGCRFAAVGGM